MKSGLYQWIATLCLAWCPLGFAADASSPVNLVFAGDIVLGDAAGEMIRRGEDPFADFASVFQGAESVSPIWNA